MCGRFTALTWDEAQQVARAVEMAATFNLEPDWPARADAFPGSQAAVLIADGGGHMAIECAVPWAKLTTCAMTWGFSAPGTATATGAGANRDLIFNTRMETAASSPFWQDSFAARRCIVPAAAFFEPHRSEMALGAGGRKIKQAYRFADADGAALLLAGIWQDDRFSIMTCDPDSAVSPIHDRMPVALSPEAARAWLFGAQAPGAAMPSATEAGFAAPEPGVRLESQPVYPAAPETGQLSLF